MLLGHFRGRESRKLGQLLALGLLLLDNLNWKEAFAQLSRNQTILDQFVAHTYGLREEANPATKFSNLLFHHEISEITRQAVLCAFSQVNFLAYSYCLKRSAATYPSNEY